MTESDPDSNFWFAFGASGRAAPINSHGWQVVRRFFAMAIGIGGLGLGLGVGGYSTVGPLIMLSGIVLSGLYLTSRVLSHLDRERPFSYYRDQASAKIKDE